MPPCLSVSGGGIYPGLIDLSQPQANGQWVDSSTADAEARRHVNLLPVTASKGPALVGVTGVRCNNHPNAQRIQAVRSNAREVDADDNNRWILILLAEG